MDFLLREWRPEDAISVARCADNEKIARNLRDVFPCPYTLQDAADYINSCIAADENRQLCRAIAVTAKRQAASAYFWAATFTAKARNWVTGWRRITGAEGS